MDKLLKVIAEQNEEAECCFQLKRIGDALEEILRLVKADQEKMKKIREESEEDIEEEARLKDGDDEVSWSK